MKFKTHKSLKATRNIIKKNILKERDPSVENKIGYALMAKMFDIKSSPEFSKEQPILKTQEFDFIDCSSLKAASNTQRSSSKLSTSKRSIFN